MHQIGGSINEVRNFQPCSRGVVACQRVGATVDVVVDNAESVQNAFKRPGSARNLVFLDIVVARVSFGNKDVERDLVLAHETRHQ